ncbi:NfeD family protein [Ancylobacter defluvii]|uniref:Membrane protein n=1 Tax=Ancylobacter defluvii TaxID=1282440 RepID=A0A9W6JV08_9HYPH|nr:NfeD family protein [Ancylobacter defluvii]MBS7587266.1 NfeD family protein [Ancylobacter defluvii]GLK81953.1 membrane protein [Ancylobacter defluvii]
MAVLAEIGREIGNWIWFIIAGLLLLGELLLPGAQLIWLGVAALATGLVVPLLEIGWQGQLVLYAVLAFVTLLLGRRMFPRGPKASDRPFLNRRTEALIGRAFVLREPIAGGVGQVRVDDTVWRVMGEDCPAGARVVVTGIDGATLTVRPEGTAA